MDLAVRTSASPAAIWAICVVAVACLAFWISMIYHADRHPYVKHRQLPDITGSVVGGIHMAAGGRSVAPTRDSPAVVSGDFFLGLAAERLGGPGQQEQASPAAQEPEAQEPGRPLVPGQRGPRAPTAPGQARPGTAAETPPEAVPAQPTSPDETAPTGAGPAGAGPAGAGPAGQADRGTPGRR